MLLEELINKDEFTSKKRELQDKIENLKSRRDKIDLK